MIKCFAIIKLKKNPVIDNPIIILIFLMESIMCDVIKYVLKGRLRGEVGKETPKKEIDNRRIFMTSHMTLSADP